MKTIVKIFMLVAMATIPYLSQAEEDKDFKKWIELAEKGYITKQEAATAIEKTELDRMENQRLAMEHNYEIQKLREKFEQEDNIFRTAIPIIACITITMCIVVVSMLAFRNQRRKDEQEKEMLNKLIDKGVFTQKEPVNLELFNAQKSVTTSKNFITDVTMAGIGFGIIDISTGWADIIVVFANILLWVGILRLIVRTVIVLAKSIKNKKVNKKVENSSTESAAAPAHAAEETNE